MRLERGLVRCRNFIKEREDGIISRHILIAVARPSMDVTILASEEQTKDTQGDSFSGRRDRLRGRPAVAGFKEPEELSCRLGSQQPAAAWTECSSGEWGFLSRTVTQQESRRDQQRMTSRHRRPCSRAEQHSRAA